MRRTKEFRMDMKNKNVDIQVEDTIDLMEIAKMFLHYAWLIVLCGIVLGAAAFGYTRFMIVPTYQSTTQVYVVRKGPEAGLTTSDLQLGTQLAEDFKHLITSRNVLEQVIGDMNLQDSYGGLKSKITVSTPTGGRILAITVTDTNPERAREIADQVRETASEHILEVTDTEAMNVIDYANLPTGPVGPNVKKNTFMGILAGMVLCMAGLVVKYLLDDTVKTAEDVEKYLGMSTLGQIPLLNEKHAKKEKKRQENLYHGEDLRETAEKPRQQEEPETECEEKGEN